MRAGILALFVLLVCATAVAQTDPIVKSCARYQAEKPTTESVHCLLYITGFMDGLIIATYDKLSDRQFCLPDSITPDKIALIVKKHYQEDAVSRKAPIHVFVTDALIWSFPCKG